MGKPKSKHLTSELLSYIAEQYPDRDNQDIADELGLSVFTIKARATKHGWKKSAAYLSAQRRDTALRCNNAERLNTPDAIIKRVATHSNIYKSEVIRKKWGLEQKTKIHIRLEPREKLLQRNRLQRLGYIVDETNLTAYFTTGTHRAPRLEAIPRGTTKGNIHSYYDFRPYGEQ